MKIRKTGSQGGSITGLSRQEPEVFTLYEDDIIRVMNSSRKYTL